MKERKKSFLRIFGWGLIGDVVIFIAALAVFAVFAITSFSQAYMIAFVLVVLLLGVGIMVNRLGRGKN